MYRIRTFHAAGLAALGLLLSACSPSDPFTDTSKALAEEVMLPAYTQWAESDRRLAASAIAYCAGNEELAAAREAFFQAQRAWAGLQPLLVGPMGEGNRAWQVQFWPDKKNLVGRQVAALLNSNPKLTRADLEKGSVVLQGLSAYEYVLFDDAVPLEDEATKSRYCPLLIAIGEHQQQLAAEILEQWKIPEGMAKQLSKFPNERYADSAEAIADLVRVQVTALDGLKKKLGAPLGRQTKGHPQPYQAEAWRSDATLSSIEATISGAQRLWQGADNDGLRQLLNSDQAEIASRIDGAYEAVFQELNDLGQPFSKLIAEQSGRDRLNTLYERIDNLHRLHQGELARALNIQIGFNAHDGD